MKFFKSFLAIFLCLSLILAEGVLFPMKSEAETISQSAPLLDISVGEKFIVDDGGTEIRQFPFAHSFGDDVIVAFSEFTDTQWGVHEKNGVRVSHDGGATWPTYIEEADMYFTSMVQLDSGELLGINYTSYFIDERHATVEYSTSSDKGDSWTHHTGTIEFQRDIKDMAGNSGWSSFVFHRGMMVMPDGSIQGLMYGGYADDNEYRVIWVKSTDEGENWTVVSDVAVPSGTGPTVYCEPNVARCADGSLLCVMRIGNAPLYQCRSIDNGLTWSEPEQLPGITDTDAYSVDPALFLMSNGVLVLSYGRPHCKMLFSADGTGNSWTDLELSFNEGTEGLTSGYTGICEVAPNKLLLIGDGGADWQSPENPVIWGKFVDVRKTPVALEKNNDTGYVEINGNTYTAVPYGGNEFLGWYNSEGKLASTNLTETFDADDGVFTPKIKNNSIFESPGFEYSELGDVYTNDSSMAIYPNWYTSADWANVNVVTSKAHNSSRSLKFYTHYRNDTYMDISGLLPNTDYTLSYSWMMPNEYTEENKNCFYGMIVSDTQYSTTSEAYSNNIGNNYGSYYPEAGVWKTESFNFNTGDLTSVRVFVEYASHPAAVSNLYIDDFTIFKVPEPLSVGLENSTDAGYITNEGDTYTAIPYDGNKFLGWYNDEGLVSTNLTETFGDTDGAITAKFKNNSLFNSPGYELEALGDTVYHEHSTVNSGWHIGASWGKALVVSGVAHSGSKSLALMSRYQTDVYTNVTNLEPNTNYTVSYYWMMQEGYDATNKNTYYGMIASGTDCETSGEAWGKKLGYAYEAKYPEKEVWYKVTFEFNTGDLTSVRLFLDYESASSSGYLYVDDFTVFKTPEPLTVSTESLVDAGYITNDSTVYTAVPYDGNEFIGWYDGDNILISADETCDFVDVNGAVTAKFKNNSVITSPGYELEALGDVVYHEHSDVNEGWHIGASWGSAKIVDSVSHSGSKAVELFSRYQQDVYTNIKNLKPYTDYTVSYYWMMKESYSTANNNDYYGMIVSSTEYTTTPTAYQNNIGGSYGSYSPEGGVWHKDTFGFNTGDLTSVRLFTEYASSNAFLYIDALTVFETPENLLDYDADSDVGKIVNGGGAATITEVDTLLSDPAVLGNKVYELTTNADFAIGYSADAMALRAGKQYDLSFWFKVADGHKMLTSTDSGQYITFFMKASNDDDDRINLSSNYTLTIEPNGGEKIIYSTDTNEFSIDKSHVINSDGTTVWMKLTASFTPSVNTSATVAIRPNAEGTVYIDKLMVTSAEDATESIKAALTTVGTAIRTNGTQALRFKASIEKSAISELYFDTYELVEYGSVAIKTSYLNGQELALGDYVQAGGKVESAKKGAAYIKDQCNIVFEDTGSAIHFTAALTEIAVKNYNTSYSVRTYAVLMRPDGSTFTVYDDETNSATIYKVAQTAYNATGSNEGYAESPEVREYLLTNILNKADFEAFPEDGFKTL